MSPGAQTPVPSKSTAILQDFGQSLLRASGLAEDRACDVAEVLLEGDLLGHTTHGFALLPAYLKAIQEKTMETVGEPGIIVDHGSSLIWDGIFSAGTLARTSSYSDRPGTYRRTSCRLNLYSSQSPHWLSTGIPPTRHRGGTGDLALLFRPGGRTRSHRTAESPLDSAQIHSLPGIPTDGDPILIDISTSSTSNGLCNRLAAAGERLPDRGLSTAMDARLTTRAFLIANKEGRSCPWAALISATKVSPSRFLSKRSRTHSPVTVAPTMNRVGELPCSYRFWIPGSLVDKNLFCVKRAFLSNSARKLRCLLGNRLSAYRGKLPSCVARNN